MLLLDELLEDPELPKLTDFRLASEDSGLKSFKLLKEVLDLWTSPEKEDERPEAATSALDRGMISIPPLPPEEINRCVHYRLGDNGTRK